MFYGLHTTKKAERDALIETKGEEIIISPKDFHKSHHKSIVCEEDTGEYYEHSIEEFNELLENLVEDKNYNTNISSYVKKWAYSYTKSLGNARIRRT